MGLLRNLMGNLGYSAAGRLMPTSTVWQPDGTRVVSAGDIGGDIQVGGSYCVRFINPGLPGCLVTITYYAVEYNDCPGEFAVQRQIEWKICAAEPGDTELWWKICEDPAEPGNTEPWSHTDYDDLDVPVHESAGDAEAVACACAEYAFTTAGEIDWDGEPFSPEGTG